MKKSQTLSVEYMSCCEQSISKKKNLYDKNLNFLRKKIQTSPNFELELAKLDKDHFEMKAFSKHFSTTLDFESAQ